ncbi:methionine ABC transporter permease [Granulicatella seriolae]|uniref:ABC transporter permease n=1 Tax=Granulicatella seriolae TaxID=2967226 RepID=A0ABT1WLS7_9LACT|nr:methionine ABC transporter permease [Granulicatella seriolae]
MSTSSEFLELLQKTFSFENVDWSEVLKATNETLYMTFVSTFYVFILGLILGLFFYLTDDGKALANKVVHTLLSIFINIFRSIPFIILIALLIPFTKSLMGTMLGPRGAIPTLVISAAPFYARLVSIALTEIPTGVVEAAESMGASTFQVIRKVLIPEALPALISGITVTAIALIGSTAVAGVIGAGGLGNLAYLIGFTRNRQDIVLVATIAILILVFIIQFVGDFLTKLVDKRS